MADENNAILGDWGSMFVERWLIGNNFFFFTKSQKTQYSESQKWKTEG